jgi:hypothetical protein
MRCWYWRWVRSRRRARRASGGRALVAVACPRLASATASPGVVTTSQPPFAAFTLAYLIAAVLCLAGAGTVLLGGRATAGGARTAESAADVRQSAVVHAPLNAHRAAAQANQCASSRIKAAPGGSG